MPKPHAQARRPSRVALSARSAMNDGKGSGGDDASKKKKKTPTSSSSSSEKSALAVGAAAVAGAAVVAALATVEGADLEDFLYEASLRGQAAAAGDGLSPATAVGSLLWSLAWRLASPQQLLLLFVGRIDGEAPAAWAEDIILRNFLSPESSTAEEAGGGAGGEEKQKTADATDNDLARRKKQAAALAYLGLFLPAGALSACALDLSLGGSATWSISSGLGALAAGLLFAAGRPPAAPLPNSGAGRRAEALRVAFADFASGRGDDDPFSPPARRRTVLARRGRCHESEVFRAFRRSRAARTALRDLGRSSAAAAAAGNGPPSSSASPVLESEFTDNEIRAEMRRWHGDGASERRTSQGYWKNLSLVVVEEDEEEREEVVGVGKE